MTRLLKLFQQFSFMRSRLFQKPPFLWSIHLAIGTTLIEDQYLLFSLLTYLDLTFKVVYKTYTFRNSKQATNPQSKAKVMDFLKSFDLNFDQTSNEFA